MSKVLGYTDPMSTVGIQGAPKDNPFSPAFGVLPSAFVGRDELLHDIGSGLLTGPADRSYYSVLMGNRGSGKTVVLTEMQNRAMSDGWIVLSVDAATDGLLERVNQAIYQATQTYEILAPLDTSSSKTVTRHKGMAYRGFGFGRSEADYTDLDLKRGLRGQMSNLAEIAQANETSILLTVDELQGIDREEGRRLSNDMQHLRREGLPVAFIGAALSEAKATILADKRMSFFKRCEQYDIPDIGVADALVGIGQPVREAQGQIENDALKLAAHQIDGSPYKMQLIGYNAWKVAGAPKHSIDINAVDVAISAADGIVDRDIGVPSFNDLSETEQLCLAGIAVLEGDATAPAIIDTTKMNFHTVKASLLRLVTTGYIVQDGDAYSLTGAVSDRVIWQQLGLNPANPAVSFNEHIEHSVEIVSRGSAKRTVCNKWMERAKARCILSTGHSGGCRSK